MRSICCAHQGVCSAPAVCFLALVSLQHWHSNYPVHGWRGSGIVCTYFCKIDSMSMPYVMTVTLRTCSFSCCPFCVHSCLVLLIHSSSSALTLLLQCCVERHTTAVPWPAPLPASVSPQEQLSQVLSMVLLSSPVVILCQTPPWNIPSAQKPACRQFICAFPLVKPGLFFSWAPDHWEERCRSYSSGFFAFSRCAALLLEAFLRASSPAPTQLSPVNLCD